MEGRRFTIVGLGELLWDLFPEGKKLGGAPSNFAYWADRLGDRGIVASRIGRDSLGEEAVERLTSLGLSIEQVQLDDAFPTGTVRVSVDEKGQPDFTITEGVAWDRLAWSADWDRLAARTDAVCFGSLAQRSPQSRDTILRFLDAVPEICLKIFDVNLRQRFYSPEILRTSLEASDIVKLNDEELPRLMEALGLPSLDLEDAARALIRAFPLSLVCVTRGARGSVLVSREETVSHGGFAAKVKDTVGSGDGFTAALVRHYVRRTPLEKISAAANRLGSWIASQAGATPEPDPEVLAQVNG